MGDVQNVIRAGTVNSEPEQDRRGWAYRIETARMAVVVAFHTDWEMRIVTMMRKP